MPKINPSQKLVFEKNFDSYKDFHMETRECIYRSIINIFEESKKIKRTTLSLLITANIENVEWETQLNFNKKEINNLKDELMSYFENIEDYETCSQIISLSNDLNFK